ncbi:uncharacterized protein MELLADRAFT_64029 [Melampsora larici-populina 98AG31]|uniref:F-box domain-containing protein n=1 Tax=Melampsora larici-populina (strain 98AG31 / pathotype 3-4-7) TaxID=747676 RepID=F4RPX4_MELLP|nr:uncharacterized protein MELLADRAFT_64029 [Melampsora larici-populina 98AG31]EGG05662.1 hypothetical protein MELLADRAFT_64029 [Melampsora larici-populina 98AG31]
MISLLPPEILLIIIDLTIEVELEEERLKINANGQQMKDCYDGNRFRLVCFQWDQFLRNQTFSRIRILGSNQLHGFIEWYSNLDGLQQPTIYELSIGNIDDRVQGNQSHRNMNKKMNFKELAMILGLIGEQLIGLKVQFNSYEEIPKECINSFKRMKNLTSLSFSSNSSDISLQCHQITKSLLHSIASFSNLGSLQLQNYLYLIEENVSKDLGYQFPSVFHFQFDSQVDSKLLNYLIGSFKPTLKSLSIEGPFTIGKLKPLLITLSNQLESLEICNMNLTEEELMIKMPKLKEIKFKAQSNHSLEHLNKPIFETCGLLQIDYLPFDEYFDTSLFTPNENLKKIVLLGHGGAGFDVSRIRKKLESEFGMVCQRKNILIQYVKKSHL